MKKSIGSKQVLYPTPLVVVGAMSGDEPTWTLVPSIVLRKFSQPSA